MKIGKFCRMTACIGALAVLLSGCGGTDLSKTNKENFDKITPVVTKDLPKDAMPGFESVWVPEGVAYSKKAPGGEKLPLIGRAPDKDTPVISDFTDLTYPDETLAITGEYLNGAELIVWAEGALKVVKPLRSDSSKIQAVIPKDIKKSMMIVWLRNKNGIGSPIRVNAPEIWWSDHDCLNSAAKDGKIRFFGSSLSIDSKNTVVLAIFEDGSQEKLEIVDANSYQITAKYPKKLQDGVRCKFYIHNGTGGDYGWSDRLIVDVSDSAVKEESKLSVFKVDDYGAKADDGKSDSEAIEKALIDAKNKGGGVVMFGKGEYNINKPILIKDEYPNGLYLCGAGEGEYDFKSNLDPSDYNARGVSGKYTLIRFLDAKFIPDNMIHIESKNVTVKDMTVNGADDGIPRKFNIFASGENIKFKNVRLIKSDVRDLQMTSGNGLVCTANLEIDNSSKNIYVEDCEFHSKVSAISIGNIEGIWPWGYFDSSKTVRNVNVTGCDFYGYTKPYKHPSGKTPDGDEGEISRGVTAINLDGAVFDNCTFQGYDRKNCRLMVRSFYLGLTTKNTYIANNVMKDVGNIPNSGYDGNTGEQILFHGQDAIGGIFNVKKTDGDVLTVRTDNIALRDSAGNTIKPADTTTNAGSRVFDGFDLGTAGAVYVSAGKGAGQVRTVTAYNTLKDTIEFTLKEPFAVEPDETSIITLTAPSMQNIVYNNKISNDEPTLAQGLKTGGVLLFYEVHKNIIANNEIRNLAFGVAINTTFKMPSVWNTVRDNTMSGIREAHKNAMQGGDTTYDAAFFCDSVRSNAGESAGWDDYKVWYTVGNVFRNNNCSDGDTAAELTTNRWNKVNPGWYQYFGEEKGNVLTIIENNKFENVAQGIPVGNPAYWSLIRNNTFTFTEKNGYIAQAVINDQPWTNFKLLYIAEDKIVRDHNNTVK